MWGKDIIEASALAQMDRAMELPISVGGACMPDSHVGDAIPIGGVLATENAVIPYAVGMDIACRMRMSILPMEDDPKKMSPIDKHKDQIIADIEKNTRFCVGSEFE